MVKNVAIRAYGVSMALLIVCLLASIFVPFFNYLSGTFALLCLGLGLLTLKHLPTRIAATLLVIAGVSMLAVTYSATGEGLSFEHLLSMNQELAGMTSCVVFLRLITGGRAGEADKGVGAKEVRRTGFINHAISSVINIISVGIIADRIKGDKPLTIKDASLLSSTYGLGAFWSPFWVAAAAAGVLMPGANTILQIGIGGFAAIICLFIATWWNIRTRTPEELQAFTGYQPSFRLLRVPMSMVLFVLLTHLLFPEISIPKLVVAGALLVTLIGAIGIHGLRGVPIMVIHGIKNLPISRTEGTLFIAAGILTIGFRALQNVVHIQVPLTEFTPLVAWGMIIVMIIVSLLGVHPVISSAIIVGLLANIQIDPTMFVLSVLIGWSLASIVGPISGLLNYLNGQYGIPNFRLVKENMPIVLFSVVVSLPILYLAEYVIGIWGN